MAKVRVVMAEVEGSDEAVRAVISQFVERGIPAAAAAAPAAIAPVVETTRAIEGPRQVKRGKRRTARPVRAAAPARTDGQDEHPLRVKIRERLQKGPLTTPELIQGTGAKPPDLYYHLKQMRDAGQVAVETIDFERKNVLRK